MNGFVRGPKPPDQALSSIAGMASVPEATLRRQQPVSARATHPIRGLILRSALACISKDRRLTQSMRPILRNSAAAFPRDEVIECKLVIPAKRSASRDRGRCEADWFSVSPRHVLPNLAVGYIEQK